MRPGRPTTPPAPPRRGAGCCARGSAEDTLRSRRARAGSCANGRQGSADRPGVRGRSGRVINPLGARRRRSGWPRASARLVAWRAGAYWRFSSQAHCNWRNVRSIRGESIGFVRTLRLIEGPAWLESFQRLAGHWMWRQEMAYHEYIEFVDAVGYRSEASGDCVAA